MHAEDDTATPRVAPPAGRYGTLLGAIAVAAVGTSGYLPGNPEPTPREPVDQVVSVALMLALAIVTILIIGVSVVPFLRRPTARDTDFHERRQRRRLSRRTLLIIAATTMAVAVLGVVLAHLIPAPSIDSTATSASASASPTPSANVRPPPPAPSPTPLDTNALRILAITAWVIVAAAVATAVAVAGHAVRRRVLPPPPPTSAGVLRAAIHRAVSRTLSETAAPHSDPRQVIFACYRTMEDEFASISGLSPAASDTASDVLFRAVDCGVVQPRTARELVTLFAEARFSIHTMTGRHERQAVALLHSILAEVKATKR